jgi:hypothetical protein
VRGDSLRDLYAKTLAVVGLGLLAGAGAIVDYWPVSEPWPAVPLVAGLRSNAPMLVRDVTREIPVPARAARRPRPVALNVEAQLFYGIPPLDAAASIVALDPMPAPDDFLHVDRALPAAWLVAAVDLGPAPAVGSEPDDSRRLFGGAIRRTRESLGVARAFLGEALSGVVVAFRKVSPFFSTAVVASTPF